MDAPDPYRADPFHLAQPRDVGVIYRGALRQKNV